MAASIKVFMKGEEKEKKIIGTPDVPISMSKKFSKEDGTVLYYVHKDWGIKRGLMSKMDFKNELVTDDSFCLITIDINRI